VFVPGPRPRFTEETAREAIAASRTWSEALRRLGYSPRGGNPRTLQKYAALWDIGTDHFDPDAVRNEALRRGRVPLDAILVEDSPYSRSWLKHRLFVEGVKERRCELCGQDEMWRGDVMALILDHVNGVSTDNRIENLRVLCPNCAATLQTHCGRKNRQPPRQRDCERCGRRFHQRSPRQRYCSRDCGSRWDRRGIPRPGRRLVVRPPYEQLVSEIEATSFVAVGRRYGVSDNAVRKWIRQYRNERGVRSGAAAQASWKR
jgi:hypothetical protein